MATEGVPQRAVDVLGTLGVIEVYEPYGPRMIEIPLGADMVEMCFQAHEIWEERGEMVRVRVIRWDEGAPHCVLHLPPIE